MSELPSTVTVNVGSPAADVVYTKHEGPQGQVVYMAPSAQGDLTGRNTIEIVFKDGKKDLAHATAKMVAPYYNSTSEEYEGHAQASLPLTRPKAVPVQFSRDVVETIVEFIPQIMDNYVENLP